ncbi:MAG TPA: hypothetical protein QF753_03815 [Victivallales bacterium]|nr:hypothetical protein [Victivallales bacterium]
MNIILHPRINSMTRETPTAHAKNILLPLNMGFLYCINTCFSKTGNKKITTGTKIIFSFLYFIVFLIKF